MFIKNDTANVSVGGGVRGGYLFSGPITAKVPGEDDFDEFYAEPWDEYENLGFVSSDGIVDAKEKEQDNITDLNGDVIGKTAGTTTETWAFMLAEVKKVALQEQYGYDNVTDRKGIIHVKSNGDPGTPRVYVALVVLKDGRKAIYVVSHGEGAISGELTLNSTTLHARQITVTCFANDEGTYVDMYIESTETCRPSLPAVETEGTRYGVDVSTLGTFNIEGNKITGQAKKVTVPDFNGQGKEQQGFFFATMIQPNTKARIRSGRVPERWVALDAEGEDGFVLVFLGEEEPNQTPWIEIESGDGEVERYTVSVTKDEE